MSNTYNTFTPYNKFKATKVYGNLEITDYVNANNEILDAGVISSKEINITSVIPITENSNIVPNTKWVKQIIADLIGGSPVTLDTLNEIAQSLGNDVDLKNTLINLIGTKQNLLTNGSVIDSYLSSNVVLKNGNNTFSNSNTFNGNTNFKGAGSSGVTHIPYSDGKNYITGVTNFRDGLSTFSGGLTVQSGLTLYNNAIIDSYLSSNVVLKNGSNTFTQNNIFNTIQLSNSVNKRHITLYEVSTTNYAENYTILVEAGITRYNVTFGAKHLFSVGTGTTYTDIATINSAGFTLNSGVMTLPNNSISDNALSTNIPKINGNNTFSQNNIFNTIQLSNTGVGSKRHITLFETSAGNYAENYTFSIEPFTLRYNAYISAKHLFSVGNGTTYTDIASINSAGFTLHSGVMTLPNNSISDNALSTNVCLLNGTQTLINKTLTTPVIAQIKPTSSLTLTLPSLTDTLISRTSTDTLTNKTLNSTNFINDGALSTNIPLKNGNNTFTNSNTFNGVSNFKGGTNNFSYETHLPYTDGKNYISGTTVMRGGALEVENDGIFLRNGNGVNMFDDEITTNQTSVFLSSGNLNFDNYADPITTTGAGNIKFRTINLDPTFPRFHTRMNINYDGVTIESPLICKKNIKLPTTLTTPTSGQLGHVNNIPVLPTTTTNMVSNALYNYGYVDLGIGVYMITYQYGFKCTATGTIISIEWGLSTSQAVFLNECYLSQPGGSALFSKQYTNILTKIETVITGTRRIHANMRVSFSSGSFQFGKNSGMDDYVYVRVVRIA